MKIECVLALDVGFKKTGVAVGQSLTGTAQPLAVLRRPLSALRAEDFQGWIKEWRCQRILIGWPQHQDGTPHPLHPHLRRLAAGFSLPVLFVDEYLSSHEARQRLGKDKSLLDAMAAVVLAEDYFQS